MTFYDFNAVRKIKRRKLHASRNGDGAQCMTIVEVILIERNEFGRKVNLLLDTGY